MPGAIAVEFDEDQWQAQNDLQTLIEAEKIKADDDRLQAAMAQRTEQMDALKNLKE